MNLKLSFWFLFAMLLGAGPGLFFAAGESRTILGLPAFYLWVIFWFFVLSGIVVCASINIWSREDED